MLREDFKLSPGGGQLASRNWGVPELVGPASRNWGVPELVGAHKEQGRTLSQQIENLLFKRL